MAASMRIPFLCTLSLLVSTTSARAFTLDGHEAIEARTYTKLLTPGATASFIDGSGAVRYSVDGSVLMNELIEDDVLDPPDCYGPAANDEYCQAAKKNAPILWYPRLGTSDPDLSFARQLGSEGQCFHFMARSSDTTTGLASPGSVAPLGLTTTAYQRCIKTLSYLFGEAVRNPSGAKSNKRGIYVLMHAVGDSFSSAHVERGSNGILFLKPWRLRAWVRYAWQWSGWPYYFGRTHHSAFSDDGDHDFVKPECQYEHPYELKDDTCFTPSATKGVTALSDLLLLVNQARHRVTSESRSDSDAVCEMWSLFVSKHFGTEIPSAEVPRTTLCAYVSASLNGSTDGWLASDQSPDDMDPDSTAFRQLGRFGFPVPKIGLRYERAGTVGLFAEYGGIIRPPLNMNLQFGLSLLSLDSPVHKEINGVARLIVQLPLSQYLRVGFYPISANYLITPQKSTFFESGVAIDIYVRSYAWLSFFPWRYNWSTGAVRRGADFALTVAFDIFDKKIPETRTLTATGTAMRVPQYSSTCLRRPAAFFEPLGFSIWNKGQASYSATVGLTFLEKEGYCRQASLAFGVNLSEIIPLGSFGGSSPISVAFAGYLRLWATSFFALQVETGGNIALKTATSGLERSSQTDIWDQTRISGVLSPTLLGGWQITLSTPAYSLSKKDWRSYFAAGLGFRM